MEKIQLDILGLSTSQAQSGSFALVLGEREGKKRRLPIIIGMYEAQSIAIEIEKIKPNRPLTHDLFKELGTKIGFSVEQVMITSLREGIFYSKIICKSNDEETIELDARPSDAIAISLRFDSPIYTTEAVLSEAGIILAEEDENEEDEMLDKNAVEKSAPKEEIISKIPVDELQRQLKEAIDNEDYERAARIRDELSKRN